MLKKIVAALFFSAALIFAFIFFLLNGIKIKSFSLGQIYISQLYIKLDKKLIVDIEEIKLLNDSKVENSYEDLQTNIKRIPTILKLFERIDIESLLIDGNQFKILFDNDHIYLDNKYVNLSTKYNKLDDTIALDLYSLYLKDIDLLLRGSVNLDYANLKASFYGSYVLQEKIHGELNTQFLSDYVDFFVTTGNVENLKFLKQFFRLDKIAEAWMYDNVIGDIKLNYLYGKINTKTFEPILDSIKGEAVIQNADIMFNKKVSPVKTKRLTVTYENDTLKFNLLKPTYKGLSIDGSKVEISNLTVEKTGRVDVLIQTKELLNDDILEITKSYGLHIPVKQISGDTDAYVLLKIPYIAPMQTFGNFYLKNAKVLINNQFPFYTKNAHVELNQDKVIIKSSHFEIEKLLDSTVDLTLDIKTLKAKGMATINDFEIKNNNSEVIKFENLKTGLSLDFNNDTLINLQKIKTNLVLKKEYTEVNIDNIQTIYPYSKLLQDNSLKNGNLNLYIVNDNNIKFDGRVEGLDLPIKKEDKIISSLEFLGSVKNSDVVVESKEKDIRLELKEKEPLKITINNFDIYPSQESKNSLNQQLKIRVIDSVIHVDGDKYYPKDMMFLIDEKTTSFNGVVAQLDIPISYQGKKLTSLSVNGMIKDNFFEVESLDKRLKLTVHNNKEYKIGLNNIDLHYDTNKNAESDINVQIDGKNSNIIINDKFTVLSTKYDFNISDKQSDFELFYNHTKMTYSKNEEGLIHIKANNVSDAFINAFFQKDFVEGGVLDVEATGKDQIVTGRINFKKNKIKNLRTLNNIILLVNTSPGLVNPFLAIPSIFGMVTSDGFNLNGYLVNQGYVDFTYNFENKFLNMYTINTVGNSVDFDGFATFDFQKDIVHSDMKLIFMKGYSSAIDVIPGLDYILLGDDKQISTMVNIRGSIEKPDVKTNVLKDSATAPLDVIKRIFTLPLKPFLD